MLDCLEHCRTPTSELLCPSPHSFSQLAEQWKFPCTYVCVSAGVAACVQHVCAACRKYAQKISNCHIHCEKCISLQRLLFQFQFQLARLQQSSTLSRVEHTIPCPCSWVNWGSCHISLIGISSKIKTHCLLAETLCPISVSCFRHSLKLISIVPCKEFCGIWEGLTAAEPGQLGFQGNSNENSAVWFYCSCAGHRHKHNADISCACWIIDLKMIFANCVPIRQ